MVMISKAIKRPFRLQRMMRGSEDGFNAEVFHKKCDGKGQTLTIIQSERGKIFGGYSTVPWGFAKSKNGTV
jgi:hypothetical protein